MQSRTVSPATTVMLTGSVGLGVQPGSMLPKVTLRWPIGTAANATESLVPTGLDSPSTIAV